MWISPARWSELLQFHSFNVQLMPLLLFFFLLTIFFRWNLPFGWVLWMGYYSVHVNIISFYSYFSFAFSFLSSSFQTSMLYGIKGIFFLSRWNGLLSLSVFNVINFGCISNALLALQMLTFVMLTDNFSELKMSLFIFENRHFCSQSQSTYGEKKTESNTNIKYNILHTTYDIRIKQYVTSKFIFFNVC